MYRTIALAVLVAAPALAQLPPAPRPVPGSLLDHSRTERARERSEKAPRERSEAAPRRGKKLPEAPAWRSERPGWARVDPAVVASFAADVVAKKEGTRLHGGVATRSLQHPDLTWWSRVRPIPAMRQACATVYLKLHKDFRPGDGGKLPGFANTGMGRRYSSVPEVVQGRKLKNTGWGGRKPDGVHWSARSGFGKWDDEGVALRTYFYAMAPKNIWGEINPVGTLPKGEWSAYVQCVKLNTPGRPDGGLYYEIVGDEPVIYARDDIRWRDLDVPEALIDEFWLDFYCGGTKCGDGPRGTISFAGAVVTRGLPDMAKVKAEVKRLKRSD
jgi:hypothetical protein